MKPSPVHRLPNEIMIEIFGTLAQDGIHSLKPLLLVDRRFSSLVASTPSLWCDINIQIDAMLQESNKLSISYINSCIMRSQKSFLHVSIDMNRCGGPCDYVASVLKIIQGGVRQFDDAIELAIHILEGSVWDGKEPAYIRRSDKIQDLVRAIVGPEGAHMRRWKSFKFSPPDDWSSIGQETWDLFQYPTPNLETFVLDDRLWMDNYSPFDNSFPVMAAVRHLTLCDPDGFESIPIPRQLLTAVIELDRNETKLDALSDCMTLQELTLTGVNVPWPFSIAARERDVKLPSLRRLTLEGRVSDLKHITFRTPRLESLRLLCGCEDGIPEVRARSVVWMPKWEKDPGSMLKFVRSLVVGIKEMEELVVKCERVEGLSLAIHGITTQLNAAIGDTLRVVRIEDVGD
ncbi:hypothetical protein FRC17_003235 [Serendipita sp. 399]|nr:hypothetical protein FRC17_003235 [Serendipita sp. 399]